MNLRTITAGALVITLAEARKHCRITAYGNSPATHPDDSLLTDFYIPAAQRHAEEVTERAFSPCVMEYRVPTFASVILIPTAPVRSIVSIKYIDGSGAEQTLPTADYDFVDDPSRPAVYFSDAPASLKDLPDAVRIRFNAGYTPEGSSPTETALPTALMQAMLLMIGHWYENRETVNVGNIVGEVPMAAAALLHSHRWDLGV